MGVGVFVVSALSLLRVIGFSNGLLSPPLLDFINFLNDYSFPSPNFASSAPRSITNFSENLPPEEYKLFEWSTLGPSLIIDWIFRLVCLYLLDYWLILNILESVFL